MNGLTARQKPQRRRDIFVPVTPDGAGNVPGPAYALLASARAMAARTGGRAVVVALSGFAETAARFARAKGAGRLIVMEAGEKTAGEAAFARALAYLAENYRPYALLLPCNMQSRITAGLLAAWTDAAVITDAEHVRVLAKEKQIVWKKSAFGGYLRTEVTAGDSRLQIGLLHAVADGEDADIAAVKDEPEVIRESMPEGFVPEAIRSFGEEAARFFEDGARLPRLLETRVRAATDLSGADVIVAGGRGAGGKEGFDLLRDLAARLGGVVAASRVAVDRGWADKSVLIGQSGKTVRPRLYIACGISGSVQHITGMRNAECVVSINTDKKALIFNVSDYCIVGDMFEIVPALIRAAGGHGDGSFGTQFSR